MNSSLPKPEPEPDPKPEPADAVLLPPPTLPIGAAVDPAKLGVSNETPIVFKSTSSSAHDPPPKVSSAKKDPKSILTFFRWCHDG